MADRAEPEIPQGPTDDLKAALLPAKADPYLSCRWRWTGSTSRRSQRCTVLTSRFRYEAIFFHESSRSSCWLRMAAPFALFLGSSKGAPADRLMTDRDSCTQPRERQTTALHGALVNMRGLLCFAACWSAPLR